MRIVGNIDENLRKELEKATKALKTSIKVNCRLEYAIKICHTCHLQYNQENCRRTFCTQFFLYLHKLWIICVRIWCLRKSFTFDLIPYTDCVWLKGRHNKSFIEHIESWRKTCLRSYFACQTKSKSYRNSFLIWSALFFNRIDAIFA